jgi:Protein of unknown function DUF262
LARKKKVEISQEELKQIALERELREIEERLYLIPEPKFVLEIGTPVRIGNLINPVVTGVFFDGKAYEITFSVHHTNYGRPYETHGEKRIVKWLDVRKDVPVDTAVIVQKDDLSLSYSQRAMSDILSKAYYFGLDLDPDYQRDHVWSIEDKVSLIDSIFNHIDIGKFVYVYLEWAENDGKYAYEVLDGKQRIRAILDFYEDKFPYKGKYFSELSNRDHDHFDGYQISYAEIRNATREQKLRYFLKLNTGGHIMSKEHLEKVREMLELERQ